MAEEHVKTIAKSVEDFTTTFHKNVAGKTEGNFVSSALSAHVVLSMAAYGAVGKTAEEMRQSLHLPENDEHGHQGFQSFIDTMNEIQKVTLKVANRIYVNKHIIIKDLFDGITKSFFRSETSNIDFSKNNESAAEINKWCVDKTNGKIDQLLTPADVNAATVMVLLNAVYFKGSWKNKFQESNTKLKPFHLNKTTTVDVPTMYLKEKFYYKELKDINADVIGLPYVNEDLMMVVIVPKEIDGLTKIENDLENLKLDYQNDLKYKREICLSLPKFKIETTIELNSHLMDLGMKEMFQDSANFNGIADIPIKVDKVIQKAFIEVNEEGSEAAAVTAMLFMLCSAPMPARIIDVNRPFLYKIVSKNVTLFSGRVSNPLKN